VVGGVRAPVRQSGQAAMRGRLAFVPVQAKQPGGTAVSAERVATPETEHRNQARGHEETGRDEHRKAKRPDPHQQARCL